MTDAGASMAAVADPGLPPAFVLTDRGRRALRKLFGGFAKVGRHLQRLSDLFVGFGLAGTLAVLDMPGVRPQKRSECRGARRPCPFVSCPSSLIKDVVGGGRSIRLNYGRSGRVEQGISVGSNASEAEFHAAVDIALAWWDDVWHRYHEAVAAAEAAGQPTSGIQRPPDSCDEDVLERRLVASRSASRDVDPEMSLEDVGGVMFITRERARQIEVKALLRLKMLGDEQPLVKIRSTRVDVDVSEAIDRRVGEIAARTSRSKEHVFEEAVLRVVNRRP